MMNGTTGCPSLNGQVARPRGIEADVDVDAVEAADRDRLRFGRDKPGVRVSQSDHASTDWPTPGAGASSHSSGAVASR